MSEPKEFRNKRGKTLWQPRMADGYCLFLVGSYATMGGWETGWRDPHSPSSYESRRPYLTSRRRAVRMARRQQRREDRQEFEKTYQEVEQ